MYFNVLIQGKEVVIVEDAEIHIGGPGLYKMVCFDLSSTFYHSLFSHKIYTVVLKEKQVFIF